MRNPGTRGAARGLRTLLISSIALSLALGLTLAIPPDKASAATVSKSSASPITICVHLSIYHVGSGGGGSLSQTTDGVSGWYGHDPLGGITDLVSSTGTIVRSQDWSAYGQSRAPPGAGAIAQSGPAFVLGYTGALTNSDGSVYLRARTYDPALGAFTQTDPAGYSGSAGSGGWYGSDYGYVAGRPTLLVDPSGKCAFWNPMTVGDEECAIYNFLGTSFAGHNDSVAGQTTNEIATVFVNIGRGATGSNTDTIINAIDPKSSCTIRSSGWDATGSQVFGTAVTFLVPVSKTITAASRAANYPTALKWAGATGKTVAENVPKAVDVAGEVSKLGFPEGTTAHAVLDTIANVASSGESGGDVPYSLIRMAIDQVKYTIVKPIIRNLRWAYVTVDKWAHRGRLF